jgi:hypothetical protein
MIGTGIVWEGEASVEAIRRNNQTGR